MYLLFRSAYPSKDDCRRARAPGQDYQEDDEEEEKDDEEEDKDYESVNSPLVSVYLFLRVQWHSRPVLAYLFQFVVNAVKYLKM